MIFCLILSNPFCVGDMVVMPFWVFWLLIDTVAGLCSDFDCSGGNCELSSKEAICLSISSMRPSALSAASILSQTRSASRSPLSLAPCSVDQYAADVASPANSSRGSSALGSGVESFSKSESVKAFSYDVPTEGGGQLAQ